MAFQNKDEIFLLFNKCVGTIGLVILVGGAKLLPHLLY